MKAEVIISCISLISTIIIGIIQIKMAKNQKSIKEKIARIEIINTKIQGYSHSIVGNSNNGDIRNNVL